MIIRAIGFTNKGSSLAVDCAFDSVTKGLMTLEHRDGCSAPNLYPAFYLNPIMPSQLAGWLFSLSRQF